MAAAPCLAGNPVVKALSWLSALVAGALLGSGLILGGMSQPAKVQAFLDVAGRWDPSLALVMVGAIGAAWPAFAWAKRHRRTLVGEPLDLPAGNAIDGKLILGSLLFGAGWGLSGLCPGPALVSLGFGSLPGLAFVAMMILGQRMATRK
ncbi:MAG: hypothetical protein K2Q10_05560 [Rhodospirillales bacterium]|nr:hypothetical protein [Rhodospirillales bacterium]